MSKHKEVCAKTPTPHVVSVTETKQTHNFDKTTRHSLCKDKQN